VSLLAVSLVLSNVCLAAALIHSLHKGGQERRELYQRIQAPRIAVNENAEPPKRKPVMAVPVDDDAAYAEARERRLNGHAD
jgi:hypothetical protein